MSIEESLNRYKQVASLIPGWDKMSKSDLANGYCDAEDAGDENKRSQFYAALICKYGYMVPYMYKTCHSFSDNLGMQPEDFIDWLTESFDIAFKYRRWRDPNNPLSKDASAPEKIINRCIYSTQKRWFAYYNKDKRRIAAYAYSLEESEELHGDGADGLMLEDDETAFRVKEIIQYYFSKEEYLKAFIMDAILNQDSFNQKVKHIKTDELDENRHPIVLQSADTVFSFRKMVDYLSNIDDKFVHYFESSYDIPNETNFKAIVDKFRKMSHNTYVNKIKKCLTEFKDDEYIHSLGVKKKRYSRGLGFTSF